MSGTETRVDVWVDPEQERLLGVLAAANEARASARVRLGDLERRLQSLAAFHDRLMAPLYAQLDDVNASIAEALAAETGSEEDSRHAAAARERADQSAARASRLSGERPADTDDLTRPTRVDPSDEARSLYRALIKRCHPDLAGDPEERERRERFTSEVNDAYGANDVDRLGELAERWQQSGEAIASRPSDELRSAIAAAETETSRLTAKIERLRRTALGRLLDVADPTEAVSMVAAKVRDEIARRREGLERLRAR